jgi:hypothetical protein
VGVLELTWDAGTVFPGRASRKRGNPWVDIPAGFSDTITGNRLNQAGLTTRADVLGLELVQV